MSSGKRLGLFIDYSESEYAQKIISGISGYVREHGGELVVFTAGTINAMKNNFEYQRLMVASFLNSRNIDGLIFVAGSSPATVSMEYLRDYLKRFSSIPLVTIGTKFQGISFVVSENHESMKEMVEHLIVMHNRHKFCLITVKNMSTELRERYEAYREVLEKYGLFNEENKIETEYLGYDDGAVAIHEYIKQHGRPDFDAYVCINDEFAFSCIDILNDLGISIPGQAVVTGFDDEIRSSCITPSVTTINQNIEGQGAAAASLLFDLIEGKEPQDVRIPSYISYRQSCGCLSPDCEKGFCLDSHGNMKRISGRGLGSFETANWYNNRSIFMNVVTLYANLQSDISLNDLSRRIPTDLLSFGITAAAVCLFDEPVYSEKFEFFRLPHSAYVFNAFDNSSGATLCSANEKISFDPNDTMLPDGVLNRIESCQVVTLYKTNRIFGYMIFKPGPYDHTIYGLMNKMISSTIDNAYKNTAALREFNEVKTYSMTDELTGLLNRRGINTIGTETIIRNSVKNCNGLVIFGDMDGLKKINDTYGHEAGDKAIVAESEILKKSFGSSCVIGRLGGDEFAIIVPKAAMNDFEKYRTQIKNNCDTYNRESGEPFILSMSLGAAEFSSSDVDLNSLLKKADKELYKEKEIKHRKNS